MSRILLAMGLISWGGLLLAQPVVDQWSCDSLDYYVEQIFAEDRFEEQSIRTQAADLQRVMERKQCAGLPNALVLQGIIYFNRKEPFIAKQYLLLVDSLLGTTRQDSRAYIRSQLWLGLVDLQENRQESALLYFDKALRLSQKFNFDKGTLQAYINLGTAYIAEKNLTAADTALQQALRVKGALNSPLWIGYAYFNLGRIHQEIGDIEGSEAFLDQAARLWQEINYPKGLYYIQLHLASVAGDQNALPERAYHLQQAVGYAEKDSTLNPHQALMGLAYYSLEIENDRARAIAYFERALENSQFIGDQQLIEVAGILLNLYAEDQDTEGIQRTNERLLNVYKRRAELARVEAQKWQRKELILENQIDENQTLREEQLESALALQERNNQLLLAGFLLVLVGGLAYLQYRIGAAKKRMLVRTQAQNEEIKHINSELISKQLKIEEQNRTILETRDQLVVQEKLASLGQMTAGIAHEIKNPLNFVNNFAEGSIQVLDDLWEAMEKSNPSVHSADSSETSEYLQLLKDSMSHIHTNGDRINQIIDSMMSHARPASNAQQQMAINTLVKTNAHLGYVGFKGNHHDFHSNLVYRLAASNPTLPVFAAELGRCILNLVDNASYAVYQKQQQRAASGEDYHPVIRIVTEEDTHGVYIKIWDNGPGIPDGQLEHIFDPFFTTKPTGEGNIGLGLSICYDIIVQRHQGNLSVRSEVGQFTEFTIALPK